MVRFGCRKDSQAWPSACLGSNPQPPTAPRCTRHLRSIVDHRPSTDEAIVAPVPIVQLRPVVADAFAGLAARAPRAAEPRTARSRADPLPAAETVAPCFAAWRDGSVHLIHNLTPVIADCGTTSAISPSISIDPLYEPCAGFCQRSNRKGAYVCTRSTGSPRPCLKWLIFCSEVKIVSKTKVVRVFRLEIVGHDF